MNYLTIRDGFDSAKLYQYKYRKRLWYSHKYRSRHERVILIDCLHDDLMPSSRERYGGKQLIVPLLKALFAINPQLHSFYPGGRVSRPSYSQRSSHGRIGRWRANLSLQP